MLEGSPTAWPAPPPRPSDTCAPGRRHGEFASDRAMKQGHASNVVASSSAVELAVRWARSSVDDEVLTLDHGPGSRLPNQESAGAWL